jgi:hypothetical protein
MNTRIVNAFNLIVPLMAAVTLLTSRGQAVTVTCKVGPTAYKKHFLGLSDNVTYFAEQLESSPHSTAQYRVVFKPSVIIPNIDLR